MTTTKRNVTLYQTTVGNLVKHVAGWRVPEFQREYVWGMEQRHALVESLVESVPIGSLVTWRHNGQTYIVDGQQRCTSLLRMIDPNETDPAFQLGLAFDGGVVDSWDELPLPAINSFTQWWRGNDVADAIVDRVGVIADRLRDAPISITHLDGDAEYAELVFRRMAGAGVVMGDEFRLGTDTPTLQELVAEKRTAF